ncbi:MAG TPA: class II aldolase/adducin family protein [candidate division Zixibacteria bacterium]|nr:class II aldolase/adducin family protein [candidate division Zixibacteria bacterium]
MTAHEERARQALVDIGRRLWLKGFVAGSDGNLSLRLDQDRLLVTPAGAAKGRLERSQIVLTDLAGSPLDGQRPSSELGMHLRVYRECPAVRACVHSHPPHATAFAVAGIEPPADVLPEVVALVGSIRLTAYAPPGTTAVGDSLEPYLFDSHAFILKNHGLLTVGASLEQAYNRHEIVESYCRILTIAKTLGSIDRLDPDEVDRLKKLAGDT